MAQGQTKGLKGKAPSRNAKKAKLQPKKGKRYIKPKRNAAATEAAMRKALSAKINKSIEQQMVAAASAGKLTIMRKEAPEASSSGKASSKAKKFP